MTWTTECQAALVQGYFDGDGHTNHGVTSAASVSEALTYGIFALCIQIGEGLLNILYPRADQEGRRKAQERPTSFTSSARSH